MQTWGFGPGNGDDEFAPAVMVFTKGETERLTASVRHLLAEVLSSRPTRDLGTKAAKVRRRRRARHWLIDPDGPEIIEHHLPPGATAHVEVARHAGHRAVELDIEVCTVTPGRPGAVSGRRSRGSTL